MSTYRWANPYGWLDQKSGRWSKDRLRSELLALAVKQDSDTLQDEYQTEMDADGYFDETA